MKATLAHIAGFSGAASVGLLALCMLGGASYPHTIAGSVFRFIFV